MSLNNIAVVCKQSNRENLHRLNLWDKMETQNFSLLENLRHSHQLHETSIKNLKRLLETENITYKFYAREENLFTQDNIDLLISLGGDGTFIHCSQYDLDIPLLGINSAPGDSIGHYCMFNILDNTDEVCSFLKKFKKRLVQPEKVHRLQAYIDKKPVGMPILNDILITELNPAEICSYLIQYQDKTEWHKSSGVWISTSNGSTAAYQSAGGKPFNLYNEANKRQYGFFVRELYGNKNNLQNRLVCENDLFQLTSNMLNGSIYIDGYRSRFDFRPMSVLNFKFHDKPLLAFL